MEHIRTNEYKNREGREKHRKIGGEIDFCNAYMHTKHSDVDYIQGCIITDFIMYIHTYMKTYMHNYMHTYVPTYMHACWHIYINAYMHINYI